MPIPAHVPPMLAVAGTMPSDEDAYAFEFKWDGIRAIALWDGRTLRLETRNLNDVTVAYPELEAMGRTLGAVPAVLDGEIVALDDRGLPSFQRLQERMHIGDAVTARRKAGEVPAAYFAFDLLHLGGRSTMALAWTDRRPLLEDLGLSGPSWATPPAFAGRGTDTYAAAEERQLEGVVAKLLDSVYLPGVRTKAWTKVKRVTRDEFVVGGWLPGEGRRDGGIGSLLLGLPAGDGLLSFCGAVGTGFTQAELARLEARLRPAVAPASPFTEPLPVTYRSAVWVVPELVVDVEYRERLNSGILRHPSYKGLRIDKGVDDVNTDQVGTGRDDEEV